MTIEVAAPISEFLSFDRTTAGVKATGSITFLTGGTDEATVTVSDSLNAITWQTLADPTAPTDAAYRPLEVYDTTWEYQDALIAEIEAALDIVATEANVGAEATVTFATDAPSDGATVLVTDALGNAIEFVFSAAGDQAVAPQVDVLSGADHLEAAANFETAVNAAFLTLGAGGVPTITAVDVAGTVTLTGNPIYGLETQVASDPSETVADGNITCAVWGNAALADGLTKTDLEATYKGTSGNETITESASDLTVSGMSSGTNAALTVGLNDTVGTPEFTMERHTDGSIKFTNADGIVRHAHSDQYLVSELFAALKAVVG